MSRKTRSRTTKPGAVVSVGRAEPPVSPQEMWNEILAAIDDRSDAISSELEAAADKFPELTGAFGLLLAYASYSNSVRSLPVGAGEPLPIEFPKRFGTRNPQILQCAQGSADACLALSHGRPLNRIHNGPSPCKDLLAQYNAAIEREHEEFRKAFEKALEEGHVAGPVTWPLTLTTQKESDRLLRLLFEQGCILKVKRAP